MIDCSMCEQPLVLVSERMTQPDNGLHVEIITGYGMFTDLEQTLPALVICHDCSIRLLELFPPMVRDRYRDGHANRWGSCTGCEYGWKELHESA